MNGHASLLRAVAALPAGSVGNCAGAASPERPFRFIVPFPPAGLCGPRGPPHGVPVQAGTQAGGWWPTIAASVLPGFDMANWLGVYAPAGTAKAVIDRMDAGLATAMVDADIRRQLIEQGVEPMHTCPKGSTNSCDEIPRSGRRSSGRRARSSTERRHRVPQSEVYFSVATT